MRKLILVALAAFLIAPAAPAQTVIEKRAPGATQSRSIVSWDAIAGSWKRVKGSVKRQWGKLTRNDIAEANGKRDILAGKIQQRYGIDKAKADAQIEAWLKQQR